MSVSYFAYTADPSPITVALLAEQCRRRGYEVRVLREFTDWSRFRPLADGAVESGDVLCGWPASAPSAPAVAAALDRQAAKAMAAHEAAGRVGVFEVEVWDDPAAYNADLEDEADGYGDGYTAARAASSTRWCVRVTGGGELSMGLAEAVLVCVLELRGGLFEDPQECQFQVVSRQG